MKEKLKKFLGSGIGMTVVAIAVLALLIGIYEMGYNHGSKDTRIECDSESFLMREKIFEGIEYLVNNYNDCSTVFNTTGDWSNEDELWFDLPDSGHVRCHNQFGRLWISYQENFDNWWNSKAR